MPCRLLAGTRGGRGEPVAAKTGARRALRRSRSQRPKAAETARRAVCPAGRKPAVCENPQRSKMRACG